MKAEILVGPERRRRWSGEEKARIVAEATAPDARVADIARRHGVSRSLVYTWRRESSQELSGDGLGATLPELVPVVVSGRINPRADKPAATSIADCPCVLNTSRRSGSSIRCSNPSTPVG